MINKFMKTWRLKVGKSPITLNDVQNLSAFTTLLEAKAHAINAIKSFDAQYDLIKDSHIHAIDKRRKLNNQRQQALQQLEEIIEILNGWQF